MSWLHDVLFAPSAVQAVIIICLICATGLALGKMRLRGISLGVTFVFFIGILAGALGLQVNADVLSYAESFGLVLFVYTLGLQVGPGFSAAPPPTRRHSVRHSKPSSSWACPPATPR